MALRAKPLLFTLVVLAAIIAAGAYYLSSNLNGIVANLIEREGSAVTQTSVSVSGVDIKLTEASAALSGLTIANPAGFAGNAIELGEFATALDAGSLTSDTIVIKNVTVDGARINVLQQGTKNNLRQLMANMQSESDTAEAADADAGAKKIIIERFTLSGASASVSLPDLGEAKEVTLPDIVLTDVGRATNGATGAQVAQQLLRPIMEAAITSATAGAIKDKVEAKVGKAVGGLLKGLTGDKEEE
ncbi:MAG: hypothetical protein Cons2KO_07570 [Congregibacter sp.]